MHTLRARVKKDIVVEFLPPIGRSNGKIIILAPGAPSVPKGEIVFKFAKLGYFCLLPRYRGSWESDGVFLESSPHKDIWDVVDQCSIGFTSLFDGAVYKPKFKKIILLGSSFGGPAVLLASKHPKVDTVIANSAVVDWADIENGIENLAFTKRFWPQAFGNGYRVAEDAWERLFRNEFYNPNTEREKIDPKKIIMIHAKDDDSVPFAMVKVFADELHIPLIVLNRGGHLSIKTLFSKRVFSQLKKMKVL